MSKKMNADRRLYVLAALMGALTYVFSWIQIPIGPVPITLQTLGVLLAGFLLTPITAGLAMIVHLLLKFLLSGASIVLTPSFGFVLAFIVVAPLISYWTRERKQRGTLITAAILGSVLLYVIGIPYMAWILNGWMGKNLGFMQILQIGMLPFLFGDFLKAALAVLLAPRLQKGMRFLER